MMTFRVRLFETAQDGNETLVSTDDVTSLQDGEDVAQALCSVFAEAYQPGLRIIAVQGGARVYETPEGE